MPLDHVVTNQETIRDTLRRAIDPAQPVALLDYPDHANVGDSAIWAGEMKYLQDGGYDIRYVCDNFFFRETSMRRVMPKGQILLHGGGNFGTVWPRYQKFRENLAERFRDYRIVQLPQSIHFEDDASIARARGALSQHPDFLLLTRDRESKQFADQQLGVRTEMCPDSALLLQGELVRRPPVVDVLVLARTDKEAKGDGLSKFHIDGHSMQLADWLEEPHSPIRKFAHLAKHLSGSPLASFAPFQSVQTHLFKSLTDERMERGVRLLSQGRIVVTDRLHAHILCIVLGIPHVVVDNSYGKLTRFISCWTASNPLLKVVNSAEEAVAAARQLLSK